MDRLRARRQLPRRRAQADREGTAARRKRAHHHAEQAQARPRRLRRAGRERSISSRARSCSTRSAAGPPPCARTARSRTDQPANRPAASTASARRCKARPAATAGPSGTTKRAAKIKPIDAARQLYLLAVEDLKTGSIWARSASRWAAMTNCGSDRSRRGCWRKLRFVLKQSRCSSLCGEVEGCDENDFRGRPWMLSIVLLSSNSLTTPRMIRCASQLTPFSASTPPVNPTPRLFSQWTV